MASTLHSARLVRWAAREALTGQGAARAGLAARGGRGRGRLRRTARELEAVFLAQVVAEMRRTVHKGGLLDGGVAQEIFEEQWDYEVARRVTQVQGLGIADELCRQLSRTSPSEAATDHSKSGMSLGGEDDANQ